MVTRLTDSPVYAHLWSTPELDLLVGEEARWQAWLDILAALARAQARFGLVPVAAADAITDGARVEHLDLDEVAEQTRRTSHSTLGLIRGLRRVLPEHAREHVALGATVQDVTDTWFGVVMREVGSLAVREVRALEDAALDLARTHRDSPMAGRTHGQIGAPITFGLKAASWADELRRHAERLTQGRPRWAVGQLGGAVGALGWYEDSGIDPAELRAAFCAEVGLGDPGVSWLTARDRVAEFGQVLALVTGTLARIGTEVYELARPEIGELAEPSAPGRVGSITMPHKRNPETSEHLDTLARLARSSAGVLLEGTVAVGERDGRGWKAEWVALPEVCLLTGTALRLARTVVEGLEVRTDTMAANLARHGASPTSERILAGLSPRIGPRAAQELLVEALSTPGEGAVPDVDDVAAELARRGVADLAEVRSWAARSGLGPAGAMVDGVLARARGAHAREQHGEPGC